MNPCEATTAICWEWGLIGAAMGLFFFAVAAVAVRSKKPGWWDKLIGWIE